MKLLLATTNPGKVVEFRELLAGCGWDLVTPADVRVNARVAEEGSTYRENARLKAVALAKAANLTALADDSGLEVDALGGAPGLHSARYAGENAHDEDRVTKLLDKLRGVPRDQRTARFRCVIAIARPSGEVHYAEGTCEGLIGFEPRGKQGFGYDPVFCFVELGKTMAELPPEVKNRISHRGRAAIAACDILKRLKD